MDTNASTKVTLKDVAARTGYSLVSVHRAISGKEGVSETTRRRIVEAAREMGYEVNIMASALKRRQTNVAIVFPEWGKSGSYYFNYMWNGYRDYTRELPNYPVSFMEYPFALPHTGAYNEATAQLEVLDVLCRETSDQLDGLITVPMENTPAMQESLERFVRKGIRVVLIDNDFPACGRLCCIAPNDENTGRLSAELMCSMVHQPQGTILIAAGNETSSSHRMNAMGFSDYVRTHRPELNIITINDTQVYSDAQLFYHYMEDPAVVAAYSVRARNTLPICSAALQMESQRKLLLLGSDLFPESADMLRRGVLKGIVYKNPYQKGFLAVKTLIEQLLLNKSCCKDSLSVPISIIMRNNLVFFEEFI